MTRHHSCRVSPFGHPRIHARLTAPRGISQPPTSFIGSQCQGIHHAPLNTYNTKPKNEFITHTHPERHMRVQKNLHYIPDTHPPKSVYLDARNHYPQIKHHTPPPKQGNNTDPHPTVRAGTILHREQSAGLLSQSPIVCLAAPHRKIQPKLKPVPAQRLSSLLRTRPASTTEDQAISRIAALAAPPHDVGGSQSRGAP